MCCSLNLDMSCLLLECVIMALKKKKKPWLIIIMNNDKSIWMDLKYLYAIVSRGEVPIWTQNFGCKIGACLIDWSLLNTTCAIATLKTLVKQHSQAWKYKHKCKTDGHCSKYIRHATNVSWVFNWYLVEAHFQLKPLTM
jgi:hypothetical protein